MQRRPFRGVNGEDSLPLTPTREGLPRWDRPTAQLLHLRLHELHRATAGPGADFANGYGGDQVFMAHPAQPIHLSDDLLLRRPRRFFCEAVATSEWTGLPLSRCILQAVSVWTSWRVRGNASRAFLRHETRPWWTGELLGLASMASDDPRDRHLTKQDNPFRARHLLEVGLAAAHVDRGYRAPGRSMLHPFLSQPLVELALRLPGQCLVSGSEDRIALREAMRAFLPAAIVGRVTKAEYSGIYQLGLKANGDRVHELALDGRAVEMGLVSRPKLEEELRLAMHGLFVDMWPLLNLLALELWLRAWQS